ncbi:MAG TPA: methyltransferase domain-containing protein, partial [Phycisphaerae bacterium]|nr:methyltransferase domain-containing protein [Phycisphaerae bacterium]
MERPSANPPNPACRPAAEEVGRTEAVCCPVCRGHGTTEFFRAEGLPVFCNATFETPEEARLAPRGTIRLRICHACGYIYNSAFAPEQVAYGRGYENALHFSPRFRSYARELAGQLVERFGLRGRKIVEIGCGDGYFLGVLCEIGRNTGVGFDPSYRSEDPAEVAAGRV